MLCLSKVTWQHQNFCIILYILGVVFQRPRYWLVVPATESTADFHRQAFTHAGLKLFYIKARTSKIVEKLGTVVELEKKLNGQYPIEWAKKNIKVIFQILFLLYYLIFPRFNRVVIARLNR